MTVRARGSWGVPLGLLMMAALAGLDWLLLRRLVGHDIPNQEISALSVLIGLAVLASLPALGAVAYHTLSCATLRYRVDRNGITIHRAWTQETIPIGEVLRILPGSQIQGTITHRKGLRWPGHERGRGRIAGIGTVHFFATSGWPDQLVVVTSKQAYAVSPRWPGEFVESLAARQELGPNRQVEAGARRAEWLGWPLWKDRTAWALIGVAVAINLALFAYLSIRFPGLDMQLPLHFSSEGQVDRIGGKIELFSLPIIGLITLAANVAAGLGLYKWERAGSYLLWGAAAAVQALFWVATLGLLL